MTFDHFACSARIQAANSAGELADDVESLLAERSRACRPRACALTASALRRADDLAPACRPAPAGRSRRAIRAADSPVRRRWALPARIALRLRPVTASALSLPALTCGSTAGMIANIAWILPDKHVGDRRRKAAIRNVHDEHAWRRSSAAPSSGARRCRCPPSHRTAARDSSSRCSMNSLKSFARTAGVTTSICGAEASSDTGSRSLVRVVAKVLVEELVDRRRPVDADQQRVAVGGALATASAPMLPPAPVRFSTTNGWPSASCSLLDSVRPTMSGVEPGG